VAVNAASQSLGSPRVDSTGFNSQKWGISPIARIQNLWPTVAYLSCAGSAFTGQNEMRFPWPVLWVLLVIAWWFLFVTSSAAQTFSPGLSKSAAEQKGFTWTKTFEGSGNTDGFRAPQTQPLPTPFRSVQLSTKPDSNLSVLRFTAYSPDRSVESLSPVENIQTLFVSQALLPVAQFWSGRLQLGASESTLHMGNVIVEQGHLGWARSVDLYGISLVYHFGRGAQTGAPTQVWRRMTQFVGAVLY
jgi:hypothetical protein